MQLTIAESLHHANLNLVGFSTPTLDAEVLLSEVISQPRSYLHAHPEVTLTEEQGLRFRQCLKRRMNHEPLAYIIGTKEFWSLPLLVTQDTLIPRPETELLVEVILDRLDEGFRCVADLGTGSGAIAIALASERPHWRITATDQCEWALQVARSNAMRLQLRNIDFFQGNWCEALTQEHPLQYDAIVSNPPYISQKEWSAYSESLAWEPKRALLAGQHGLEALITIMKTAKGHLKSGGYLAVEHGYLQGKKVRAHLQLEGYENIHTLKDFQSIERVSLAVNPG